MNLKELDKLWEGDNIDKYALKLLCRKFGPELILDWVHRGLTVNKDIAIEWHKNKMLELGVKVLEQSKEVVDNQASQYGEYFQ